MRIDFNNFYLFCVPVNFDIAWFKILYSNHLIVKLSFNNKVGIGEGVLYQTNPLKTLKLLENNMLIFFKQDFSDFGNLKNKLYQSFSAHPGLVCAFDLALWDLEAKIKSKPVYQLINKKKEQFKIPITEQIFIQKNKQIFIKKVKKILSHGTRSVKLKAGVNIDNDFKNIKIINKLSNNKIRVQLDINKGLSLKKALRYASLLKNQISAWEEPIHFKNYDELRLLRNKFGIPIILDESVKTKKDLINSIYKKAIDILNIKINRLGGLTNSLEFIKVCNKHKIGINIGCNEELGIGLAGQWHLSTKVNNFLGLEVLGSDRLGFNIVKENTIIKNGFLKILPNVGLGIHFIEKKLINAGRRYGFIVINKDSNWHNRALFFKHYLYLRTKSKFINGLILIKKILFQR